MKINRNQAYDYLNKLMSLYNLKNPADLRSNFSKCVRENYSILQGLYNANTEGADAFREFQNEVNIAVAPKTVEVPAKTEPIKQTRCQKWIGREIEYRIIEEAKTEKVPLTQEEQMKINIDLLEKNEKVKAYINDEFEFNIKHCPKEYAPSMSAKELDASEFLFNPNKSNIIVPNQSIKL